MPIQGSRNPFNNPLPSPQFGSKAGVQGPQQPRKNPFETALPGGAGKPPGDHFDAFKTQLAQRSIQPNLERPQPPVGMGNRLLTIG
jgi:hypothetical protein